MNKTIFVTGSAGFIGFHLSKKLLDQGYKVVGLDNFNNYYDPKLKEARNQILEKNPRFTLYRSEITDKESLDSIIGKNSFDVVCHLAAQAGVRYSIENPFIYENSNNLGTLTLLESLRKSSCRNFIFASSSSVYGGITEMPFKEDRSIKPISLYAATKASNELTAHAYHKLFDFNTIGLRFFTVYGPWGRPDMALFKFTEGILNNEKIKIYNHGKHKRDFTYVDDIVEGILGAINVIDSTKFEIINLGRGNPENLMDFVKAIENATGKIANKEFVSSQLGDVESTYADITKARKLLGYMPKVSIDTGVKEFVDWYKEFYHSK